MNIIIDNDLLSIQEARILVENAAEAQKQLAAFPQAKLDEIVERIAEEIKKHTRELAHMSHEETDYGKWEDKYIKNEFVCESITTKLRGMHCVGVIQENADKTVDIGVPIGIIVALCPDTSPVSTTIYKALIAIKSGNAIIFSPHPRTRKTVGKALDIIIRAAEGYGLPEGAISYLHTVTPAGTEQLMNHDTTSLILNTCVPNMLQASKTSGKSVIYGGIGNVPVFIERTAKIEQAVKDIVTSKTFDYGVVAGVEQAVVVDSCIHAEVKEKFIKNGAYFMTEEEAGKLGNLLYRSDGTMNTEMIGISAQRLANRAGFTVPDHVKVLIAKQKYVTNDNPYSKERLCPVLTYYIEEDWMNACEKCIELLINERNGHTLVIHSTDESVIRQFALKKPVGRILVNTSATFGSLGATTNLFPAMTLGSGSVGLGISTENVSPMDLVYIRKVGYSVRTTDEIIEKYGGNSVVKQETITNNEQPINNHSDSVDLEMLTQILTKVMQGN